MSIGRSHICVCVCTYKRPQLLERLLNKLQGQRTGGLFTYSVLVVDNDHEQSAKSIVISWKKKGLVPIDYYIEPEKNIARARNKAVQNANGDFVAFIDDDEFPVDDWLLHLHKTCFKYKADGVLGPVIPHFEVEPPKWVVKGKFCERPTYETGARMHWNNSRAGNALLRKCLFEGVEYPFNPAFGVQGEDVKFFKEMNQQGHNFVWCNDAPVYEIVTPDRFKKFYFLRRAFVQGNISFFYYEENRVFPKIVYTAIKSGIAFISYTGILAFAYLLGVHPFMKYLIKDVHHVSRLLALLGLVKVKERTY